MNRVLALDALRGFALIGIVLGNVQWFTGYAVDPLPAKDMLGLDAAVTFALHVLVDGKFYALFSLLFGASFAHLLARERRRGRPPGPFVRRRLLSLLVVGMAHASLLWFGDILSLYAVAALPLLAVLRAAPRVQLGCALGLLSAPAVLSATLLVVLPAGESLPLVYGPMALVGAFGGEDVLALLHANAAFLKQRWVLALASGRLLRLLGMFVLGAMLVRRPPVVSRRSRGALLLVAVLSNLGYAALAHVPPLPPSPLGLLRDALACLALPSGALAYAAVLWPRLAQGRQAKTLAAAGRLSLTHYLGQSLVLAGVFYGVGLGFWGGLGATAGVLVGGALVGVQIAVSPWLIGRLGRGPAERLLRAMDLPDLSQTQGYRPAERHERASSARGGSSASPKASLRAEIRG